MSQIEGTILIVIAPNDLLAMYGGCFFSVQTHPGMIAEKKFDWLAVCAVNISTTHFSRCTPVKYILFYILAMPGGNLVVKKKKSIG